MSAVKAIGQRRHTLPAEDSRRAHIPSSAVRLPTLGGSVPLRCVLYKYLRMHAVIIIIIIIIIMIIIIDIAVAGQYHTAAHTTHHTRFSTRGCDAS